ncbi:hypothetical protein [Gulosibacter chungangensis]|uniref:hypothetical protein n=1 Tax=Gulosibacter chungangensis TaxID=979746 RepID=UPI001787A62A
MDEALRCDRLLLIRAGSIIADTTPAGLLESTGTTDPESAFLALLREGTSGADSDATRPPHPPGRHAKPGEI